MTSSTGVALSLDAMAHGGDAVGRLEGRAVFVPGGVAGDEARVELTEDRGRFARGRLLEITRPSPDRVAPPCPHVSEGCGGCPWQIASVRGSLRLR